MASRDIANMHIFLEMKKKFPYLPEETLRNYIFLYVDDQKKCISILEKKHQNIFHSNQFSEVNSTEAKAARKQSNPSTNQSLILDDSPAISSNSTEMQLNNPTLPASQIRSATVVSSENHQFSEIYRQALLSSQSAMPLLSKDSPIMFSTTKEHYIHSLDSSKDSTPKHAVTLSITPTFPMAQLGKPPRHTTSVNFRLEPQSGVSSDSSNLIDSQDYGSQVQISVASTYTPVRLHQSQRASVECNFPPSSSQLRDGIVFSMASGIKGNDMKQSGFENLPSFEMNRSGGLNHQPKFGHGLQASPDYISAVKSHQRAQLDQLQDELDTEKITCYNLKSDISQLEKKLSQKEGRKSAFSYAERLKKLKDENRELQVEVNCLFMEYDSSSKGKIPVGVTDEDFYSNIFTGPDNVHTLCSNGFTEEQEEDEERNKWRCQKCTFANHPALEKCEMCELHKNAGFSHVKATVTPSCKIRTISSHQTLRRPVGSVKISVTRRVPSSPKSIQLQLTHRRTQ